MIALHVTRPSRTITVDLLRRVAEVALAVLLILVLLPGVLGAAG